ncbi:MAG: fibronectin type III domain-containing protein [Nitrospiraceae bacterium]|nr:fibronectin type III domain-containing protein [Nitrospiraceae bacterium]
MTARYFFSLVVFLSALLIVSCGKKGNLTLLTFEPPKQISELKAVHREDILTISWSISSSFNLKGFSVERSEDGVNFRRISFNKPEQTSYSDSSFKPGSDYYYRVGAVSKRDIPGIYSPVKKVSPGILFQPPAGLSYRQDRDYVEISWQPVNGALYNIYKGSDKDKTPSALLNAQPLQKPMLREKADFTKDVYYAVSSLNATELKDEGYLSDSLMISPSFFKPAAPSGIRYAQSKENVTLIWNENNEQWLSGYRIYRKRAGESSFSAIGDSVVPAFSDAEAASVKTLYCITALGRGSESPASEPIEINPLVER